MVWYSSNIRISFSAEKAENLIKYTDFTELKKITSRIYSNCSNYSSLILKSFKFRYCSFYFIKKCTSTQVLPMYKSQKSARIDVI